MTAIYKDGTILKQFAEDGTERLFKEIDQDNLSEFRLDNRFHAYRVSLDTGDFGINDERITFNGFEHSKFKLVYFKRVRQNLGGPIPVEVTYNIGWQVAGSSKQVNQQRIMQIHRDNSISFEIK